MSKIKVFYKGIEINYNEKTNLWECKVFRHPRISLKCAKETIDTWIKHKTRKKSIKFLSIEQNAMVNFGDTIELFTDSIESDSIVMQSKEGLYYRYSKFDFPDFMVPLTDINISVINKLKKTMDRETQLLQEIEQIKNEFQRYNFEQTLNAIENEKKY